MDYYGVNDYGRPIPRNPDRWVDPSRTRTRAEYPYSYDEFFIFGNRQLINQKRVLACYSDRLYQWWVEKKPHEEFHALWRKHVGDRSYSQSSLSQLSDFLTAYYQTLHPKEYERKKLRVIALAEGCNQGNGYPYWVLWYRETKLPTEPK